MDKYFLERQGPQGESDGYSYFGQADAKGIWKGLSAIWWDTGDAFIGEWSHGDHHGPGISIQGKTGFTVSNFDSWTYSGPTVVLKAGILLFGIAKDSKFVGNVYAFEPGEKVRIIDFTGGTEGKGYWTDYQPKGDFMPGPFSDSFKVIGNGELSRNTGGSGTDSYVSYGGNPNGELTGLCATIWDDQMHLGNYTDSKRFGFGVYKWDKNTHYAYTCWTDVSTYTKSINYYAEEDNTSVSLCYESGKEKTYFILTNSGKMKIDIRDKETGNSKETFEIVADKDDDDKADTVDVATEDKHDYSGLFDAIVGKKPTTTPKRTKGGSEDKPDVDYLKELENLIGLANVKKKLKRIRAYCAKHKDEDKDFSLNFVFLGNPGTGKTEVARLFAGILHQEGILPTNKCVETDRSGLIAGYVGQTGPKVHKIVNEAMGGVLFIDEAYSLFTSDDEKDFGPEAVAALLLDMENYRGQLCFILAGYKKPMENLLKSNIGFRSRIQDDVLFPDYSREELGKIAALMLKKKKYQITDEGLERVLDICDVRSKGDAYGNARELRNIFDELAYIQSERTIDDKGNNTITLEDVDTMVKEEGIVLKKKEEDRPVFSYEAIKAIADDYDPIRFDLNQDRFEEAAVHLLMEGEDGSNGEGTGFIISSDGVVATCAHCVEGMAKITAEIKLITIKDQRIIQKYETRIIGIDHDNDVAVIKIMNPNIKLEYLPLKDYGKPDPKPLTNILMAGYPFGGSRLPSISFTEGKVQAVNNDDSGHKIVLVDLSGHGGNSGSAVLDMAKGDVIGVFSGALLQPLGRTGSVEEINYFRPIEFVWNILMDPTKYPTKGKKH